ncbi:MAG: metalloregulator ArsR/SmtB family transcription factor [gamma proteobacterium symbiont of Bathyaustriella thionipta]|nr:metalloregulator ArsR/SmtB family transcription factor [gamma proteobacterium symbiont of Bathyaustriella thionipta]MCU7949867.1 metalloregulator ArsR/SmtB family transcription factor [gamma proteobacterium symbiont of Bathyaustriella thionipta]MCU7954947.1 metalloregulator ArsR/SmtB family transcription factor [gamma proteobacterium symbiont of Bathyaustriella thionipta]MCU7956452.1 metalloregulator ArsR/SmtB family transcription factor [gamma proteobacterium symbiont of Bathyaustriella thio
MLPTQLFKSVSDETRLRCLSLLVQEGELCVCELTYALKLPQPKISHHLANLRKARWVIDRKEGLWIYYRLNPELPQWAMTMIQASIMGIKNDAPYASDLLTLLEMTDRPVNTCSA